MTKTITTALAIAYIAVAFLTAANYSNHRCDEPRDQECEIETFYSGFGWPLYWAWRGAVFVTR